MRKFLAPFLTLLALAASTAQGEPPKNVDLSSALFTMPTISNDMAPLERTKELSGGSSFAFHEDEWSQVEFLPKGKKGEIQNLLKEYKVFEASNRTVFGKNKEYIAWKNVYVRRFDREVVIPGASAVRQLEDLLGVKAGSSPRIFTAGSALGIVANGFSIDLGEGITLYGYSQAQGIPVLGAFIGDGANIRILIDAFRKIHRRWDSILVDWREQILILAVASDGRLEIWQP